MFRTELPFTPHPSQLPLSARVLTVGSCFSDTIGGRLAQNKVSTLVNPFGTVFNPLSACKLLRAAAGEEIDWQQHLTEARGRWQSFDLHATIGADSPVTLLQQIREVVQQTGVFLETADVVLLTLGTAFTYRLLETQEVVSNCHKVPAEKFEKELLTPDEIINAVAETHAYLRLKNPKLRFILTVSPVRHLKDTLPLNAVSKSVLRVACHYLSELLPDVSYFPAYELLLDDLRDYRFYAADMLHPSEVAENYIWEKFTRTYFDQSFGRFKKDWEAVQQALGHRPLYPAAPEHRAFLEGTLERLQKLATQADVRLEIREVQKQLMALPPPPKPTPAAEPEPDDDEERIDIGEVEAVPEAAPSPVVTQRPGKGRPVRNVPQRAAQVVSGPAAEVPQVPATPELLLVEAPMPVAELSTEAQPEPLKKKRRSRGGAKRTARKNAARAAQEAAQQPAANDEAESVGLAEPEAAEAEPLPEVPFLTQELVPVRELATTPAPVAQPSTPATDTTLKIEVPAPRTDWLVPMAEAEDAPKIPKRQGKGIVRTPPTRNARKPAEAPVVTPPKAAAKPKAVRAPRRKAPVAAGAAVVDTASRPAEVAMPPAPIEAALAPAPEVLTPEPPAAAPKKRARPPRKKPAAPDKKA